MLSNMASSLIIYEYIETTNAKAKACKQFVDHLISLGKKSDQKEVALRRICSFLKDPVAADKLVNVIVPRYKDRVGGYVSIVKRAQRTGDNAAMSKLVLIGSTPFKKKKKVMTRRKRKQASKRKVVKEKQKGGSMLEKVRRFGRKQGTQKGDKQIQETPKASKDVTVRSRSGI